MKQIVLHCICIAFALSSMACHDDFSERHTGGQKPTIPFDFDWEMTQDVALSVCSPTIDGLQPEFALINIYSSPVIDEVNLLARGMVDAAHPTFATIFTTARDVENIYVQTVIPDGRQVTEMVALSAPQLNIAGAQFSARLSAAAYTVRAAAIAAHAAAREASSLVLPVTESIPTLFDKTIVTTPTDTQFIGNGSLSTYLIPAGVTIDGHIDMAGTTETISVLYVAGKLVINDDFVIKKTRLVLLKGGELVVQGDLKINNTFNDKATVYAFEETKMTVGNLDINGHCLVVNQGDFCIAGNEDSDSALHITGSQLYTTTGINASARGKAYDPFEVIASSAEIHNDGLFKTDDMEMDASSTLVNYENGEMRAESTKFDQTTIRQKGLFVAEDLSLITNVTIENYCNITVNTLETSAKSNFIQLASGSLFTVIDECEMNYTTISMAKHSIFEIRNMTDDKEDFRSNKFSGPAISNADCSPVAVLKLGANGHGAQNDVYGLIEIVLNQQNNHKLFAHIKEGATLVREQTVNIPATGCNKGVGEITPDPIEPQDEFEVKGATYTYSFEDGWPWFGDYDMNDLVVVASVDRKMRNNRVEAIRINWEARASGAGNSIAFALYMDKVPTANIASVTTTHPIGIGAFEVTGGLERDNEYAVIPLFNSVSEVLGTNNKFVNTENGMPKTETQQHTTTITFATPTAEDVVIESALNFFLAVSYADAPAPERWREIHLPSYKPTKHASITGFNTIIESMPYKFYTQSGDLSNNGLMWGLRIPGEFRYPSELNDIRTVYTKFMSWAQSGGAVDKAWYTDEAVQSKIYQ
ncbi:MAG: LruC domain-containing protein [Alistipes sp.]